MKRQPCALAPEGAHVAASMHRAKTMSSTGWSVNRRMVRAVDITSQTSPLAPVMPPPLWTWPFLSSDPQGLAAVDNKFGSRDERRMFGHQKRHRVGDLGRLADPAEHCRGGQALLCGFVEHRSLDRSGEHRVDPDAELSELGGGDLGQAAQRPF